MNNSNKKAKPKSTNKKAQKKNLTLLSTKHQNKMEVATSTGRMRRYQYSKMSVGTKKLLIRNRRDNDK